jgi:hypothetical protein
MNDAAIRQKGHPINEKDAAIRQKGHPINENAATVRERDSPISVFWRLRRLGAVAALLSPVDDRAR